MNWLIVYWWLVANVHSSSLSVSDKHMSLTAVLDKVHLYGDIRHDKLAKSPGAYYTQVYKILQYNRIPNYRCALCIDEHYTYSFMVTCSTNNAVE